MELHCDPENDIVVEIGSGVAEGSTEYLYHWASERHLPFYSIDVSDTTKNSLQHLNINFVVATGHEWCRDVLPTLQKNIKVLYLDNFDYLWEPTPNNLEVWGDQTKMMLEWFEMQKQQYARRGVVLTNENSMEEHRLQTMYCLPYMSAQSIILMDDTLKDDKGPYGKCATALPLMIEDGYKIDEQEVFSSNCYQYVHRN